MEGGRKGERMDCTQCTSKQGSNKRHLREEKEGELIQIVQVLSRHREVHAERPREGQIRRGTRTLESSDGVWRPTTED
jgi:hypothetical protein